MSDFSASIRATLDTTGIPDEIRRIEQNQIKFSNLTFDRNKLVSEVQSALDSHKFTINFGNVGISNGMSGLNNQFNRAGAAAGKNFSSSFVSSLNDITIKNGGLDNLRNLLTGVGYNTKSVDGVIGKVKELSVETGKLKTSFVRDGNIEIDIKGVDKFGNAINVIKTYDKEANEISEKKVSIEFDINKGKIEEAKRYASEVNAAFASIMSNQSKVGTLRSSVAGLDTNTEKFKAVENEILRITSETERLFSLYENGFSDNQYKEIVDSFDSNDAKEIIAVASAIDKLTAAESKLNDAEIKKNDASYAKFQKGAFDELISIRKEMNTVELDMKKANQAGNLEGYSELNSRFEQLKTTYRDFLGALKGELSTEQLEKLEKVVNDCENRVRALNAQYVDGKNKLAQGYIESNNKGDYLTLQSNAEAAFAKISPNISEFSKGTVNYEQLKTEMDSVRIAQTNLQKTFDSGNTDNIVAEVKDYLRLIDTLNNKVSQAQNVQSAYFNKEKLSFDKESFTSEIDTYLKNNKRVAKSEKGASIVEIKKQVEDADKQTLSRLKAEFRGLKREADSAGLTTSKFIESVKKLAASYLTIQSAIRVFKDMYKNVLAIDTAMTNLYKVTDETEARYNKFLKTASSTAKEVGRTVSGYIEQAAQWSKLGYSLDEAERLSKISSIYANVGEIDDKTAVSDLVTALKGFNMNTDEADRIADVYNELGNKFAVSAADIGDGVKRSAAAMKVAGSDLYQTSAMIVGISEVTQNASEAGNSLKIASMRIRGMKGELEALGEEVDENVDSISKVQTQILNLTKGQVNIFDNQGQFREYYEIMEDIAKIFNDLSSTEQASLTEILFGKMRGNQGAALIQAFQSGQVQSAYQKAIDSQGSAAREQEKWMQSLEARVARLKASWEDFSNTFLSSSFLKSAIDTGTAVLNIIESITENLGTLNTVLIGFGAYKGIKSIS